LIKIIKGTGHLCLQVSCEAKLIAFGTAFAILSFQQTVSDAGRLDLATEAQKKLLEVIKPQ